MRAPLPPALFILCAIAMVAMRFLLPGPLLPVQHSAPLGAPLLLAGIALAAAGSRLFARLGTNIHTFREPDILVTAGIFRRTRNPMYLGFLTALVGLAITLGSTSAALGVAAFFLAADRWYIPFEERMLSAKFGPAYDAYRRRTRRWI